MSQKPILIPEFGQHVIEGDRKDGYWVETFHFDKPDLAPGIITYVEAYYKHWEYATDVLSDLVSYRV
jgi:hypothetical protein